MSLNYINQQSAICEYVCGRCYKVDYNRNGYEASVKGLLLSYCGGNIVLISDDGIYHIKHNDIVFMKPIPSSSLESFNEDFLMILNNYQGE